MLIVGRAWNFKFTETISLSTSQFITIMLWRNDYNAIVRRRSALMWANANARAYTDLCTQWVWCHWFVLGIWYTGYTWLAWRYRVVRFGQSVLHHIWLPMVTRDQSMVRESARYRKSRRALGSCGRAWRVCVSRWILHSGGVYRKILSEHASG